MQERQREVDAGAGSLDFSRRTEQAYVDWIRRYIVFHDKKHPSTMGAPEISTFLSSGASCADGSPGEGAASTSRSSEPAAAPVPPPLQEPDKVSNAKAEALAIAEKILADQTFFTPDFADRVRSYSSLGSQQVTIGGAVFETEGAMFSMVPKFRREVAQARSRW